MDSDRQINWNNKIAFLLYASTARHERNVLY